MPPRKLAVSVFSFLKGGGSIPEHLVCNLSMSVSSTFKRNTDKKEKGSIGSVGGCWKRTAKVDYMKSCIEIQTVRDDPTRLEKMTVQELRTMMRSVGIPIKGIKQDLVAAMKNFLANEGEGGDERSLIADEDASLPMEPSHLRNTPKKRSKNSTVGDNSENWNTIAEVTVNQRKESRRKSTSSESAKLLVNSSALVAKQTVSVKIGTKPSQVKRKASSSVGNKGIGSTDEVILAVDSNEPWTVLAHKKPLPDWIPYNPRTMRPSPPSDGTKIVKLMSWNVNGLRALLKLEGFSALELAKRENFDVLCLQETKLQEKDVEDIKKHLIDGYDNSFWTCSVSKLGYSGTAVISRVKPLSVKYGLGILDHDSEGRLVTVEFDTFYLISGYVPNSGDGLKRLSYRVEQWDPSLSNYMKELEKSKPVILTGDLNCAHQEIDIFNPAGNRRSAGFTDEERESFDVNFLSRGFVDTFRQQHPGVVGYTYWGYRHGERNSNKGWRLDYFLVSESIADNVYDSYILPDVKGSDHCPIGLILKL